MTLRSWVVVGPVGGRPARNVWYSPHYAHVRGVTGADQPQHRSSASPPATQNPAPFSSSELFFGAGYPLSTFIMADA
ncbi:hypothetical protein CVAR292_00393 [Corynebacterium variabile]|uniref:Uncharacterized protein n=1 Tax=Corynebacterium variabile TaxID=1727 RepID=A0A0X2NK06_9CORY|nr:hypothetical protein CVAR292_00393 [Corynebacterium variabile]